MKNIFSDFTKQYALSKTLRFELKPIGKTRENMDKELEYDPTLRTFLKDQRIEDAYQTLKPVFDKIHETFITQSLESNAAKEIDFSIYLKLKTELQAINKKDNPKKSKDKQKEIEGEEKKLRAEITATYNHTADRFKKTAGTDAKGKNVLKENGYKVLTEAGILRYIEKQIDDFVSLEDREGKSLTKDRLQKALSKDGLSGFFTYLSGFNQNRENYYSSDGKSTAVANRVVDENLPKFCDNLIDFMKNKDDYLRMFDELSKTGKTLVRKDSKGDEVPLEPISENIFKITHFGYCLSQSEIDAYNELIGNANFLVNLYKQQTGKKINGFKILYKQIGCGERKDFIKAINNSAELKTSLTELKGKAEKYFVGESAEDETLHTVKDFTKLLLNKDNYAGVYWNKTAINTVSNIYFANWYELSNQLMDAKVFAKAGKDAADKIRIPDAVELQDLFEVLNTKAAANWKDKGALFKDSIFEGDDKDRNVQIISAAEKPSEALLSLIFADLEQLAEKAADEKVWTEVLAITNEKDDESKAKIKNLLDNILGITRILKYFVTKDNKRKGAPGDANVGNLLDTILEYNWFKNYDAVRNYLTKKPQSGINKLKLNFENSTLAGGWDENKETDNSCIILQDDAQNQYLAIMRSDNRKVFEATKDNPIYVTDGSGWAKMKYKLLPGPNKMLPKVLFSKKWIDANPVPENIERIYKTGTFKKGDDFDIHDLHALIDFYKDQLKKYPSVEESWDKIFGFKLSDTKSYESIDQFYSEVEKQGYKLDFAPINKAKLDEYVENGKIFLFAIKNQDYNKNKIAGHKNNLHTIYWQAVFGDTENRPKLNGEAEIFFRPALPENSLEKTKDKSGKEVIKNFRFSKEKFVFHCPITLNFGAKTHRMNDLLNKKLANSKDVCLLGIDRGEKHLAYYSLINQKGEILKQGSFNIINKTDYSAKLEELATNRDTARKNWTTINTIKELKNGYISLVVREIVDLAVAHGALIVLEDLNSGFKNSRKKIEKSIYQKLELALAKKLNFLVDKNAASGENGSVEKALQLAPPVTNFSEIEKTKQWGIMLYTRANYTSQTDPKTGWRKTIYLKSTKQEDLKQEICEKFDDFGFDGQDYYFDYTDRATEKKWHLYSGKNGKSLDRFRGKRDDKNIWQIKSYDIVSILDGVFEDFDKNRSFRSQILDGEGISASKIPDLKFAIELIQQIRNSGPKDIDGNPTENDDFILSPVRDEGGNHFDSRTADTSMPQNGDANGAYNIARKGIMMFERISAQPEKPDLLIRDEDWDKWLDDRSL
jgi:hypothetical protein